MTTAVALMLAERRVAASAGIAFRSGSLAGYGGSHVNLTIPPPAGVVNNDIMVAMIATGALSPPIPSTPTGWSPFGTDIQDGVSGSFFVNLRTFWKRALSESGSYTFNHPSASSAGWIGCYSGCIATGTPLAATSTNTGFGNTSTGLTITTTASNSWLLWLGHDFADFTNNLTPPTGMTERLDAVVIYAADQLIASVGATGNRTMTNNNLNTGVDTFGVRMVELLAGMIDFPTPGGVGATFAAPNGVTYQWNGTVWVSISAGGGPPSVVVTTVFTASGTWTPNAKMVYAKAQGWGAGGAGGSCASAAANGGNAAGGGAAGSWAKIIISKAVAGASQTVTIGAAAAQPASGNVTGGVGGDTSLGVLLVAKGGAGGVGQPAAGSTGLGGLGVVAGNVGDETGPGMSGGSGGVSSLGGATAPSAPAPSNHGGSAIPIGSGGRGVNSVTGQGNGEAAIGFASGGSGAMSYSTGAATRGAVGTGGYLVVEEYCTP